MASVTQPDKQARLRQLPAVQRLVSQPEVVAASAHSAAVAAAQAVLDEAREAVLAGAEVPALADLVGRTLARLMGPAEPYKKVVNATGVLLHTNLGRAPLSDVAWRAMAAARGACDLELDLGSGKRASRHRGLSQQLEHTTGAEAGLAVNNNAAALLLAVTALAGQRPVAVSRGQLVEIGGGFRLPEIIAASGNRLLEIGTTNQTRLEDYEEALAQGAGLVLLVHRSNFVMKGYVGEPAAEEVVAAARRAGVPTVLDLGSGALLDTRAAGLEPELTVPQAVAQGFDVVCFSGDKLLGGPQAGLAVGKQDAVARLERHPLMRALRCDKLQLAALSATLGAYERQAAASELPLWRALLAPVNELRARAAQWREAVGAGEVIDAPAAVGGGSLPESDLADVALALDGSAEALLAALRRGSPPVVAHIVKEQVLLHPRTVLPADDEALVSAVRAALGEVGRGR
jgi:L-seryl-tRNA(Ser) seleniumtransferase